MFECDACGLIFGGANACPACGSMVSHDAPEEAREGRAQPKGPLPGLDQLKESMDGIDGIEGTSDPQKPTSSLPFDIGGSSGGSTSLPFGVGSPSRGEEEFEATGDQPTPAIETRAEAEPAEPAEPTPSPSTEPSEATETPDEAEPSEPTEVVMEVKVEQSEPEPTPEPAPAEPEGEVVLIARILGAVEPASAPEASQDSAASQAPSTPEAEATSEAEPPVVQPAPSESGGIDDWAQTVAPVDQDVLLYEEEVVYHDFGDEMQVSEVIVDFDSLVDPAEVTTAFDPSAIEGGEPEMLPARALALTGLSDEKHKELAHVGFAALAQSEWQQASDCFRRICSARPTDSAALNNFGLALLQQALLVHEERPSMHPAEEPHFEAAVLALRQAAKADPEDVAILCNLATSLTACYRHDAAVRVYEAALAYDANDLHSMNGMAVSLIGLMQFDEAISILREASEISPDHEVISANLHRVSPMG